MSFLPLTLAAIGTGLKVYSDIQTAKSQAKQLEYAADKTERDKARMAQGKGLYTLNQELRLQAALLKYWRTQLLNMRWMRVCRGNRQRR